MSNNEIRKRKNKEAANGRHLSSTTKKQRKGAAARGQGSLQTSFLCLLVSGALLTGFLLLYADKFPWHVAHRAVDSIAKKLGHHRPVHAVVIDAGSTGSRVLAFTFHESYFGNHLILDKELFKYSKPGLSSFADHPEKGAETIAALLKDAQNEIPEKYWNKTPLILKATAGLRLLPAEKAEGLLNAVKKLFKSSPFLTDDSSVEIMDGTDEGIFSWFTVNFLQDRLNGNPSKTVAALDLGGGSTQVTFSAQTPVTLAQTEYIKKAASPGGPVSVYTHSYLGLGLMAARQAILTHQNGSPSPPPPPPPPSSAANTPTILNITSVCVNHLVQNKKFLYAGVEYRVSGAEVVEEDVVYKGDNDETLVGVDFEKCTAIVREYVAGKATPPDELTTKLIFAFSYYFDRAADVGLIGEATGGWVKVVGFKKTAENACSDPDTEQSPFLCLDLTFIWILLQEGFALKEDTTVYLYKKINGHEISWALGAAYNVLRG